MSPATIAAGLASLQRVRGRFEAVDAGQDFTVLVDYAHTPDGLVQALGAARELTDGRLFVVFGAGGDRDQEKRPLMGEVAARLADLVVVTSDNPRSEDPGTIIDDVVAGALDRERVLVVTDRAQAIDAALWSARPGDVVVVAGKGHESGQEIAGQVRPFDDATVVREVLGRILSGRRDAGGAGR
jgi:UDP-N-acetylmuramoyl-L-alanyl-D-glutamate--2,6-diaminopimelate ligase